MGRGRGPPASCRRHAGLCPRSSGSRPAGCPPSPALEIQRPVKSLVQSSSVGGQLRNTSEMWGVCQGQLIRNAACLSYPGPAKPGPDPQGIAVPR